MGDIDSLHSEWYKFWLVGKLMECKMAFTDK